MAGLITMRNFLLILFIMVTAKISFAQTNTFPLSGDVGIGTTNPNNRFHLNGGQFRFSNADGVSMIYMNHGASNGTTYSEIDALIGGGGDWGNLVMQSNGGNVGIGTTNPANKFHLNGGQFRFSNADGVSMIYMNHGASTGTTYSEIDALIGGGGGWGNLIMQSNGGNVGIGTTSPSDKLSVNGKIRAKEIKVETGWADFVFKPDYKLRNLKETEEFIAKNGHLPEIPSAKEVELNGINVGEMNAKLLQKIEELTLYVIDLKKENDIQQKEINQLKSKP